MTDSNEQKHSEEQQDNHAERVTGAFGSLEQSLGTRLSEAEERLRPIREAALRRDRSKVEEHLAATKHESNWLYEELIKHPQIARILEELNIMGF